MHGLFILVLSFMTTASVLCVGFTALHLATLKRQHGTINLLLDAGADVDAADARGGRTSLFHAAEANDWDTCDLLLQRGADVNSANFAGETAVFAANGRKHNQTVALLVKYGAQTFMPTSYVYTD